MFFKKSSKDRYLLTPTSGKAMYTVLVCGSASGLFMSPLVVFKGLHVWVLAWKCVRMYSLQQFP